MNINETLSLVRGRSPIGAVATPRIDGGQMVWREVAVVSSDECRGTLRPIGDGLLTPIFEAPDPSLTKWHYAQAVRMRIRGFSVGMHSRPRGGKRRRDDVPSEEANEH